jgi:hypothetical protein
MATLYAILELKIRMRKYAEPICNQSVTNRNLPEIDIYPIWQFPPSKLPPLLGQAPKVDRAHLKSDDLIGWPTVDIGLSTWQIMIDYDRLWQIMIDYDIMDRNVLLCLSFWRSTLQGEAKKGLKSCEILRHEIHQSHQSAKIERWPWPTDQTGPDHISKIGLVRPLLYLFGEGEESSKHPASCASREPATKSTPLTSSVNNNQQ